MSNGAEKKERVIHTRVPESLDDEIKKKAGNLGLSVSNLVRNILQNTFGLVEDIVSDSAEVARSARGAADGLDAARARPRAGGRVLGWQLALLNVNAVCEACNAILPKGTQAGIGITDGSGPKPFRCEPCVKEIGNANDRTAND